MEQPCELARQGIDAGQVRSLMEIIFVTGQGQIAGGILTPVLPGHDMFDVKREERVVVLVQTAVFAAAPRPPSYQFAGEGIHYELAVRRARALAWRIATTLAAMT